jgi:hypothetical protein
MSLVANGAIAEIDGPPSIAVDDADDPKPTFVDLKQGEAAARALNVARILLIRCVSNKG